MDLPNMLRNLGNSVPQADSVWEKAKPHARSVEKARDYYLRLLATKTEDRYRLDIQRVPCESARTPKEIFFVKLPTNGDPYSCSATIKQLVKPVGLKLESYAFYQMAVMLPEEHPLHSMLLDLAVAWGEKRIDYECQLDLDTLTAHLKEKGYKSVETAPTTLILNGIEIMKDPACQQAWYERYVGGSTVSDVGECIYCGSAKKLLVKGSSKWKLYTTTRKTQTANDCHTRCQDCEEKISKYEQLLESHKVQVGKDTFQFCFPIVKDIRGAEPLIKRWLEDCEQKVSKDKLTKAILFRDLVVELNSWDAVSQLVYLTATIQRQKTFDLKKNQAIPVVKLYIQQALEARQQIEYMLSSRNIYTLSYNQTFLLKKKMNEHNRDKTRDLLVYLNFGLTPFTFGLLTRTLRTREKEIAKLKEENTEGYLLLYQLLYLYLKGVDILSLTNTKEYAIGVLLKIARDAQYRKYKKGQPPVAKKFVNVRPGHLTKIYAEAQRVIDSCSKYISAYEWRMIEVASKNMDLGDMEVKNLDERLVPFYMGYRARDFYPEIEKRPAKIKGIDLESETAPLEETPNDPKNADDIDEII